MNALIMIPNLAGFQFTDLDLAGPLEKIWGRKVHQLDPDAIYREHGMSGLERHVCESVERNGINVIFYWTAGYDFRPVFFHDTLRHVFRVLMTGDDEYGFDIADRYYGQCFDLVLTHNPLHERYRLYGIEAKMFPSVYNASVFCPAQSPQRDIDASFVGTAHNKSGREAAALAAAGIDLKQYGPGSPAGVLSRSEVIEIYRRSRVNLNFTGVGRYALDSEQTIVRRIRQVKGRCTKIALCGSFVLSEYAPGIENLFEIGREIDVFTEPDELVEKVRFYLAHEALREEMAARARARALEEYDEDRYWSRMAREIESRAEAKRRCRRKPLPLCVDPPFWSAYGAWRFKYLAIFLFTGRLGLFVQELMQLLRARRFNVTAALWLGAAGLHSVRDQSRLATWTAAAARRLRWLAGFRT